MTKRKAKQLCSAIRAVMSTIRVEAKKIGNGEWIVLINDYFHLWEPEDWEVYLYVHKERPSLQGVSDVVSLTC